jgi:nucleoside-diphosphate kinase
MQTTFVMVKPDGVQRGLIGEVISRLEDKGLKLVACKLTQVDRETAERHYAEHTKKPFFEGLVDFITSGPVLTMAWRGKRAVEIVRRLMGATDPGEAAAGTIRGDFGMDIGQNLVHGADSPASAERELNIFFDAEELLDYGRALDTWIYED